MNDLTAEKALEEVEADNKRRAIGALLEEQRKAAGAKERARKAQARFDRAVAMAISSKPKREDWYAYPGKLDREEVRAALKMNVGELHRLMKRVSG
jgi:hypothetical protein